MRLRTTTKSFLLAASAISLLLLVAACGDDDDDSDFDSGGEDSYTASQPGNEEPRGQSAADSREGTSSANSPTDDGASGGAIGAISSVRKIIFTSGMSLEVEDVTTSFQTVSHIAAGAGGFVESSDLSRQTGSDGEVYEYASITIRVPSTQYGSVLEELRGLPGGTVVHEDSRSTEVTEEYTDITSRIRNLERTENRYLALLEDAVTIQDILLMTDRLDGVRLQIEQLQGRLNLLDDLVDLATIDVSLAPANMITEVVATEPSSNGPMDALADAWDVSLVAIGGLLIVLAYAAVAAIWIGPLLLVAFFVARWRSKSTASHA